MGSQQVIEIDVSEVTVLGICHKCGYRTLRSTTEHDSLRDLMSAHRTACEGTRTSNPSSSIDRVVEAVRGGLRTPAEVTEAVGLTYSTVTKAMSRARKEGTLSSPERGHYEISKEENAEGR